MLTNPNIKPTFFNTRKEGLHWNYIDINNYLFIILFDTGAELSFILRDLKKNKSIKKASLDYLNPRKKEILPF